MTHRELRGAVLDETPVSVMFEVMGGITFWVLWVKQHRCSASTQRGLLQLMAYRPITIHSAGAKYVSLVSMFSVQWVTSTSDSGF